MKIGNTTYRVHDVERYRKAKAAITAMFGGFMTATIGGLLVWCMMLKRGGFYIGGEWILILLMLVGTAYQTIAAREANA